MRDDKISTKSDIVNVYPTKGTHWVMFVNEFCFDSYGCPPPLNIMSFINNGFYSEYHFQKNDGQSMSSIRNANPDINKKLQVRIIIKISVFYTKQQTNSMSSFLKKLIKISVFRN